MDFRALKGGISGIFGGDAVTIPAVAAVADVVVDTPGEFCGWLLLRFLNGGISGMWIGWEAAALIDGCLVHTKTTTTTTRRRTKRRELENTPKQKDNTLPSKEV